MGRLSQCFMARCAFQDLSCWPSDNHTKVAINPHTFVLCFLVDSYVALHIRLKRASLTLAFVDAWWMNTVVIYHVTFSCGHVSTSFPLKRSVLLHLQRLLQIHRLSKLRVFSSTFLLAFDRRLILPRFRSLSTFLSFLSSTWMSMSISSTSAASSTSKGLLAEWHKMWSRLAPQICHFFWLITRNQDFEKKVLYFNVSRQKVTYSNVSRQKVLYFDVFNTVKEC